MEQSRSCHLFPLMARFAAPNRDRGLSLLIQCFQKTWARSERQPKSLNKIRPVGRVPSRGGPIPSLRIWVHKFAFPNSLEFGGRREYEETVHPGRSISRTKREAACSPSPKLP